MRADAFVDTNVLLYAISTAPGEAARRERARGLLAGDGWGLSVQVLQEFYVNATRGPDAPMDHGLAQAAIRQLLLRPVIVTDPDVLLDALWLKARFGLAYWDAAIVAGARRLGARVLFSEDLSDGQDYDGVTVVNPFRAGPTR
jgi:predicted nucleic acid-binding protein